MGWRSCLRMMMRAGLDFLALWHMCVQRHMGTHHTHSHVQHRKGRRSSSHISTESYHYIQGVLDTDTGTAIYLLIYYILFLGTREMPWISLKYVKDPCWDCHHILAPFSITCHRKTEIRTTKWGSHSTWLDDSPFFQSAVSFLSLSGVPNCSPKSCTKKVPTAY